MWRELWVLQMSLLPNLCLIMEPFDVKSVHHSLGGGTFDVWSPRSTIDWATLTVSQFLHTVEFANEEFCIYLDVSSVRSPVPSGFSKPWYCWKTF